MRDAATPTFSPRTSCSVGMYSRRMLIVVAIPVGEKKTSEGLFCREGSRRRHCVFVYMNRGWKLFSL